MTLDNFDLKFNFGCASCGYKDTDPQEPLGRIPVSRVIDKLDALFACNDMAEAGKLLSYWRKEAASLRDKRGELTIVSEQLGYFRKTAEEAPALEAVSRAQELIAALGTENTVSSATVLLNAATTLKAFGMAEEALPLYEKAQSIYAKNLSENDVLFAGFYNNYALALVDLGRFCEAEEAYQKALSIVLSSEKSRLDGAVTYVNMAHMYLDWDEKTADDIKLCLQKAQEILEDKNIPQDGYLAFVLSKCAPAFRDFGKQTVAEAMEKKSEALYEGNRTG